MSTPTPTPTPDATGRDWNDAPLADVVDHILTHFHRPLESMLERLGGLMGKVLEAHGDADPHGSGPLAATLASLDADLRDHMGKEEQILFPMILAGNGPGAEMPMQVMEAEHRAAEGLLERLRELTRGYTVPEAACPTRRALIEGLGDLDADLQAHIAIEDEVLFPRARGAER